MHCGWHFERQQTQQHHGQRGVFVGGQSQLGTPMQAQAVKQLGFVWRQRSCQTCGLGGFWVGLIIKHRQVGHGLQNRHTLQNGGHVLQSGRRT